ncbi:hypothetical protein [Emticicia sp. SJ17W-69]|uniref:hypothetical protein n=1 Tax=Emticicia sp. SJ17W-69 TaxID=3421657 RepID=UPI003EC0CC88
MKLTIGIFLISMVVFSCENKQNQPSIIGTWELVSATSTEKDSTVSTFNPKLKMIKIINPTHFAFLSHDLSMGKDSVTAAYSAGGGQYTLKDSIYTEHLEYFSSREWENNKFEFVVKIVNDTLIQKGIEKVEKLGVDHIIIEKYRRVKN